MRLNSLEIGPNRRFLTRCRCKDIGSAIVNGILLAPMVSLFLVASGGINALTAAWITSSSPVLDDSKKPSSQVKALV